MNVATSLGRFTIVLNAWAIVCCSSCFGTDLPPWRAFTALDSNGHFYASVAVVRGKLTVTLAERKPGRTAVKPTASRIDVRVVGTRKGDIDLGHCELDVPPADVLVSSTGMGAVAIDAWPSNQTDFSGATKNAMISISNNGVIQWRKNLEDLFGGEKVLFTQLPQYNLARGRVDWYRSGWIDETSREVVIVGFGQDMVRVVSVDTGRVRRASPEDICRAVADALAAGDADKLDRALPLLAELGSNLRRARSLLSAVVADGKVSLANRLMAALPLAKAGDQRAVALFIRTVSTDADDRSNGYAIGHLQEVLGDNAVPLLRKAIQQNRGRLNADVRLALERFGEKAMPILINMLDDQSNVGGQYDALCVLATSGPKAKRAVPALIRELDNNTRVEESLVKDRIDCLAAHALGAIGPAAKDALPAMIKINQYADAELRESLMEAIARIER
jgi:hypothetical protein